MNPRLAKAVGFRARALLLIGTCRRSIMALLFFLELYMLATLSALLGLTDRVLFFGMVLGGLSAWPIFLFAPRRGDALRRAVRSMDKHALAETALFAKPGPARDMAERLAGERIDMNERDFALVRRLASETLVSPRLRNLALLVMTTALLVQIVSFLSIGGPSLGFVSPSDKARSAISTAVGPDGGENTSEARRMRQEGDGRETEETPLSGRQALREGQSEAGNAARPMGTPEGLPGMGSEDVGDPDAEAAPMGRSKSELARNSDAQQEGPPGASQAKGGAGSSKAQGDRSAKTDSAGYEGSGSALSADPMLPYKSYLDRILAERSGDRYSASSEASGQAALLDFVERLYSSFRLGAAVDPVDDPLLVALRDAWRRTREEEAQ